MISATFFDALLHRARPGTAKGADPISASRRYLRIWRDCRHLESLPDYLLRDIGLTRSDIRGPSRARIF